MSRIFTMGLMFDEAAALFYAAPDIIKKTDIRLAWFSRFVNRRELRENRGKNTCSYDLPEFDAPLPACLGKLRMHPEQRSVQGDCRNDTASHQLPVFRRIGVREAFLSGGNLFPAF